MYGVQSLRFYSKRSEPLFTISVQFQWKQSDQRDACWARDGRRLKYLLNSARSALQSQENIMGLSVSLESVLGNRFRRLRRLRSDLLNPKFGSQKLALL